MLGTRAFVARRRRWSTRLQVGLAAFALLGVLSCAASAWAQAQPVGPYTVVIGTVSTSAEAEALWGRLPNVAEGLLVRQNGSKGLRYWVGAGRLADRPAAERLRLSVQKLFPRAWVLDLGQRTLTEPPRDSLVPRPAPSSLAGFIAAYTRIHAALGSLDTRRLQPFVHPQLGLWLRHRPGRLTVVQQVHSLDELLALTAFETGAARAELERAVEAYRPALLPADSLLPDTASAALCADADTLTRRPLLLAAPRLQPRLNSTLLAAKVQLLGEGLSKDEAARTTRAEASLRLALLRPNAPPLRGLYFAFVADRWYLTLIDLSCEP